HAPFLFYAYPPTATYTLSLHDALPICRASQAEEGCVMGETYGIIQDGKLVVVPKHYPGAKPVVYEDVPLFDQERQYVIQQPPVEDRKSTRLNSSHVKISYAVFCLKKKI